MAGKVIIKNGEGFRIEVSKNNLVEIDQSPDGLVFKFKDQSFYQHTDTSMPIEVKEHLKQTDLMFESGTIVIDLANKRQPVYVDFTEN